MDYRQLKKRFKNRCEAIFIFGAGGHAKELRQIVIDHYTGTPPIVHVTITGREKLEFPVISEKNFIRLLKSYTKKQRKTCDIDVVVALGSPKIREKVVRNLKKEFRSIASSKNFVKFRSYLSRLSAFSYYLRTAYYHYEEGLIVAPGASVTEDVKFGKHVHLNTGCTVCHDVKIGDFSIISPGATVCGNVTIGKRCYIGAGATIRDGVSICNDVVIGAGATVVKNISKPGVYAGTPAKFLRDGYL